jgi:2-polyprenyl-3-methyl-5-hydroxy-6-metoxy-1,4-benzoquinol methylase
MIHQLKQIKHQLYQARIQSFPKKDEFDPKIYDDSQFKDRSKIYYRRYARVLFDLFHPLNYMDIGCANAYVADYLLEQGVDAYGIEGAKAAFKYMPKNIKPRVKRLDLRQDWTEDFYQNYHQKFELVNFTEVAEHLKPESEEIMLQNVKLFVNRFLVISWSNQWDAFKGTPKQEHFNPRSHRYVINRLLSMGFQYRKTTTQLLNRNLSRVEVYPHWYGNIMVFSL